MDFNGAIATIFFFVTVSLIWGGFILTRHRERMSIIEKGLPPEEIKAMYEKGTWKIHPLSSLKWGIVLLMIGAAWLLGIWLHEVNNYPEATILGLIVLFGGVGLVVFYAIAQRKLAPR